MAENAAPALFFCSKKPKMLVYFCSLYASVRKEEKVRTGGSEDCQFLDNHLTKKLFHAIID